MPTDHLITSTHLTVKPIVLLVALATVSLLPTLHAADLLPNPGFELWETRLPGTQTTFDKANITEASAQSPENWAVSQEIRPGDSPDRTRASFSQDTDTFHEGTSSLKITIPDAGGEIVIGQRSKATWHPMPFPIEPGKSYTLRGWIRTQDLQASTDPRGTASVRLADNEKSFFAANTTRRSKRAKLPDLFQATDWTPFELHFDASPDDTWCYITIDLPAEIQGTVWIDDLTLTPE